MTPIDRLRERIDELRTIRAILPSLAQEAHATVKARLDAFVFAVSTLSGSATPEAAQPAPPAATTEAALPPLCDTPADVPRSQVEQPATQPTPRKAAAPVKQPKPTKAPAATPPAKGPRKNNPWTPERLVLAERMWRDATPTPAMVQAVNKLPGLRPVTAHQLQMVAYHRNWPSRRRGPTAGKARAAADEVGAAETTDPIQDQDEAEACDMIAAHKSDDEIAEYFGWSVPRVEVLRAAMIAAGTYEPRPKMETAA